MQDWTEAEKEAVIIALLDRLLKLTAYQSLSNSDRHGDKIRRIRKMIDELNEDSGGS